MRISLEQLKDAAIDLPDDERAKLAKFLIDTLDEKEAAEIRAAWIAVAEERMEELRSGKVQGIPAEEVLRTLFDSK